MRKMAIVLTAVGALTILSHAAWAFQYRESCSGRGYLITPSGTTPVVFTLVESVHYTNASIQILDALSETINSNGLTCQYALDTTQTSTAAISSNGSGTNVVYLVGVAGNPSSCAASFTAHNSFVLTSSGVKFIDTDPGTVTEGDCLP